MIDFWKVIKYQLWPSLKPRKSLDTEQIKVLTIERMYVRLLVIQLVNSRNREKKRLEMRAIGIVRKGATVKAVRPAN